MTKQIWTVPFYRFMPDISRGRRRKYPSASSATMRLPAASGGAVRAYRRSSRTISTMMMMTTTVPMPIYTG
ncbi:MAG: hypothetical protein ACLP70_20010, partial [Streptosporangiaceae bacterium]